MNCADCDAPPGEEHSEDCTLEKWWRDRKLKDCERYMNTVAIAAALYCFDYRDPDVSIEFFKHPYEGYGGACLAIVLAVPDAYHPEKMQQQRINVPVPPMVSPEHFYDWLLWRLMTVAKHEVNEFAWVSGAPRHDPHADGYWNLR